jgi:carboxyl-terminal processing protease
LGEAGLRGQIGGGTEGEATVGSSVYIPADPADDNQLNYAIDLLLGNVTNPAFPRQAEG